MSEGDDIAPPVMAPFWRGAADGRWIAPFWDAAREGRLMFQRCTECSHIRWPAAPMCPECLQRGGEWVEVSKAGTIWSFAIYEVAYDDAHLPDLPYNVALVDLDAGPRLITNIVGIANDQLEVGMRVTAVFVDGQGGLKLVKFSPAL